jgi:hypothetical protein
MHPWELLKDVKPMEDLDLATLVISSELMLPPFHLFLRE